MEAADKDLQIGIEGYSSLSKGFPGLIKQEPEDFIVEEIPKEIKHSDNGKYQILRIRLKNWDTNKFLIRLAKHFGISKKRITYAGTKDKAGITTQYFCINAPMDVSAVSIADSEVLEYFRSDEMLRLGDLVGNRFEIAIEYIEDMRDLIGSIHSEVADAGGFPNFYGIQRFGSLRTNTHKIGRSIVKGFYEEAVKLYIYDPEIDQDDFRINFGKTGDASAALEEFPPHLNYERTLLGYIKETGKAEGAFERFPRNLSMLFVHAYQSYIFNRILSERMKITDRMDEILEGDIAYPVDRYFNMKKDEPIKVNRFNLEKIQRLANEDKVRASLPIFGFESSFDRGQIGEIEHKIMDAEGISPDEFRIQGFPEISSKGERRIVSAKPVNFAITGKNKVEFSLGRGIYATSLLREFLK